jgi:hypothetical protein
MSIEMDNRLHALERRVAELERRITTTGGSRSSSRKTGSDVGVATPNPEEERRASARRSR